MNEHRKFMLAATQGLTGTTMNIYIHRSMTRTESQKTKSSIASDSHVAGILKLVSMEVCCVDSFKNQKVRFGALVVAKNERRKYGCQWTIMVNASAMPSNRVEVLCPTNFFSAISCRVVVPLSIK